ncbi:MAG TPA: RNA polymerase sigma factor [Urbifossiella sp.]|nr:RNA polymerase sigma factor [Urbifossiella sp.]
MPAAATFPAPPPVPDAALLERSAGGDADALDELFRRYRLVAYRVAYRLLGNEADALDAVQDAFVKALANLDRFRGRSSFKTWLLRIASNAALDMGRRRRRDGWNDRPSVPATAESVGPDDRPPPDHDLERADLRRLIDGALAALPAPQRQTFVLHVDGEMTYREVADTLGISIGTVMSRLFYARQKLQKLLADRVRP